MTKEEKDIAEALKELIADGKIEAVSVDQDGNFCYGIKKEENVLK